MQPKGTERQLYIYCKKHCVKVDSHRSNWCSSRVNCRLTMEAEHPKPYSQHTGDPEGQICRSSLSPETWEPELTVWHHLRGAGSRSKESWWQLILRAGQDDVPSPSSLAGRGPFPSATLFRPTVDWMRPSQKGRSFVLYSVYWFKCYSSPETPSPTPGTMFGQMSGRSMVQSSWHLKLTIVLGYQWTPSRWLWGHMDKFTNCVNLSELFNFTVPLFPYWVDLRIKWISIYTVLSMHDKL